MADIKNHSTLTTSLVSYWDLEEASGTRYDLHGSNNLTDNNTVTSATGKVGNAADFEASNSEYLSITDASQSGLDITGDLSFSAWIKLESLTTGAVHTICAKDNGAAERSYLFSVWDSGTNNWNLMLWSWDSGSGGEIFNVTWSPSTATWYHVVMTYDVSASKAEFFVNGSSIGSETLTNTDIYSGSGPFSIGGRGDGAYLFDGVIDEVGIWSKVLTSTEITDLYNSGNGLPYYDPTDVKNDTTLSTSLVSYWELEADGTDSHGTNTLTGSGSPTYVAAKIGNGVDFEDTSSQYLNITDASQTGLDFTSDFSFSCWIKMESQTDGAFYYKWGASQAAYGFLYANVSGTWKLRFNGYTTGGGANYAFDFTQTLTNGTWYHVVSRYKASTTQVEVFVNGVGLGPVTNASYTGSSNTTGPFSLSSLGAGIQWYLDGVMDEAAIWGKWLSNGEVRALYGYGTPPEYEVVAASSFTPRVSFIM